MIMMIIMPTAPWLIQLWDPSQWEAEVKSPGTLHAGIALLSMLFSCARHNMQVNGVASA